MATVKVIRKNEKTNSAGKAPLYLRIIKNRKPKYVALGVLLTKSEWDEGTRRVTKRHPNSSRLNKYIAQKFAEAEGVVLDLEDGKKFTTSQKIKEDIMGKPPTDFFIYAQKYIDMLDNTQNVSMHKRVSSVIKKL